MDDLRGLYYAYDDLGNVLSITGGGASTVDIDIVNSNLDVNGNDIKGIDELVSSGNMTLIANNGDGKVRINGTLDLMGSCRIEGSGCDGDLAERMHSRKSLEGDLSGLEFESGDVVCVSGDLRTIEYCDEAYDANVLGAVNYGATLFIGPDAPYPVSLAGVVASQSKMRHTHQARRPPRDSRRGRLRAIGENQYAVGRAGNAGNDGNAIRESTGRMQ